MSTIEGLPYLSFSTPISLKNTPLLNPVPRAFVTASLAANLFAYEDDFFNLPSDFLISISVNTLLINLSPNYERVLSILLILIRSLPIPIINYTSN